MNGIVLYLMTRPSAIKRQLKLLLLGVEQSKKAEEIKRSNHIPVYNPPDWLKEYEILKRGNTKIPKSKSE